LESIKRRLRQLGFVWEEALVSISRSLWMSWVVIVTMAVSLSILGGFWMLSEELNDVAASIGSRIELMVFLDVDADAASTAREVRNLDGVQEVELVTREQAWEKLQTELGQEYDFRELVENPLPDTLRIKVDSPAEAPRVAREIGQLEAVEEIRYGQDLLAKIEQVARFTRLLGLAVTGILFMATLAVTGNTIRLAIQARRREIEIMQLVGASATFIHLPFLLEGLFFGLGGTVITAGVLFAWRTFVQSHLREIFPFLPIQTADLELLLLLGVLLAIGMGMGMIGSLLSVKRHLRQTAG